MIIIADSGSTKTDWCVVGDDGSRATIATRGLNPFHLAEGEMERVVRTEVLPKTGCKEPPSIFFYGSGCRKEVCPKVRQALAAVFPGAETIEVQGDLLGAARALCGDEEGLACILGTGSNSCLYDGRHIVANTPPLGYILGDEGGGAYIGKTFLNAMYKGALPTEIREAFEQEVGLDLATIIRKVYTEPQAARFLASLSRHIAHYIYNACVKELVTRCFVDFFRHNLQPYHRRDLPVGFVGSIAHHYEPLLQEAAAREGYTVGRILRSPMEGLIEYHKANQAPPAQRG